jgi:hypothetical protein
MESLILMIPDGTGVVRNLLKHYTSLTLGDVKAHALTYIGQPTRASQASAQLALCILASMGEDFLIKLLTRVNDYTVQGNEDGPCMLKSVISIVTIESKSSLPLIKKILGNLGKLMKEVKSDITEFNLRVDESMNQLRAANDDYTELLDKLFAAYQKASDKEFVRYIADKQSRWEDNELEILPETLMALANDKYKTLIMRKTWNVATEPITHSETGLSHIIECSIHWANDRYETKAVLSHVLERSIGWAKKVITRKARSIRASFGDFGAVTSFWAYGHADIWAHTCRTLSACVDAWWRRLRSRRRLGRSRTGYKRLRSRRRLGRSRTGYKRLRSRRRLGRLRTGYHSKPGNRRYRMGRKTEHVSTYRKWDSYSRYSRYFDAREDHFRDTNQFDRSDHPWYFDATPFETEWVAYEREFSDAMQFCASNHEFLDVALVPGGNEDFELPTDLVDALQHRAKMHIPSRRGTRCGTFRNAIRLIIESATRLHAFYNESGNVEPSTLGENAFYCMPANEGLDDESSDLDPDGFDKCMSKQRLRGSRIPTSQMSNRRPQWEDKAGLGLFRHSSYVRRLKN